MITHVVLLKPPDDQSHDQRRAVLEAVEAVAARCPSIRACRVGRRVLHGLPGYEQSMHQDYQYALLLDFDDLQGLTDYLTHPDHARLGHIFSRSAGGALAYDYELADVREARSLL